MPITARRKDHGTASSQPTSGVPTPPHRDARADQRRVDAPLPSPANLTGTSGRRTLRHLKRCMMLTGQPRPMSAKSSASSLELPNTRRASFRTGSPSNRTARVIAARGGQPPRVAALLLVIERSPKWVVIADTGHTSPARPDRPQRLTSRPASPGSQTRRRALHNRCYVQCFISVPAPCHLMTCCSSFIRT